MERARVKAFLVLFFTLAAMVPALMAQEVEAAVNSTRRNLGKKYRGPCVAYNMIDKCWRCQPDWANNRKRLADCVQGFGHNAIGGKNGEIYVVTDPSDNDMVNPKPGTLRHAVIQKQPLWIVFADDMIIKLSQELIVTSFKTIDGRGANVHIAGGSGFLLHGVESVIINNLHIHNIVQAEGSWIRDSVDHVVKRGHSDGDGINIAHSHDIWIDHCSMLRASDGIIDVVQESTDVTVSNCHFVHHNKTLLFGASDNNPKDKIIRVTVAYNHFGKKLIQRLPALRWGFAHIVNNDYTHWEMYAIGGADASTIISQGNRFVAPNNKFAKEVCHRNKNGIGAMEELWRHWTWRSEGDLLMNGATFTQSGDPNWAQYYKGYPLMKAEPGSEVGKLTQFAGTLPCKVGMPC